MSIDAFDADARLRLRDGLARTLGLSVARIEVSSVEAGSTRVLVQAILPPDLDSTDIESKLAETTLSQLKARTQLTFAAVPEVSRVQSPPPPPHRPPSSSGPQVAKNQQPPPHVPPPKMPPASVAEIIERTLVEVWMVVSGLSVMTVYLLACFVVAKLQKTSAGPDLAWQILLNAPGILLQVVDILSDIGFVLILDRASAGDGIASSMKFASIATLLLTTCVSAYNWLSSCILGGTTSQGMWAARDKANAMLRGLYQSFEVFSFLIPSFLKLLPWQHGEVSDLKRNQNMPTAKALLLFYVSRLVEDVPQLAIQITYVSTSRTEGTAPTPFVVFSLSVGILSVLFTVVEMFHTWARSKYSSASHDVARRFSLTRKSMSTVHPDGLPEPAAPGAAAP